MFCYVTEKKSHPKYFVMKTALNEWGSDKYATKRQSKATGEK